MCSLKAVIDRLELSEKLSVIEEEKRQLNINLKAKDHFINGVYFFIFILKKLFL